MYFHPDFPVNTKVLIKRNGSDSPGLVEDNPHDNGYIVVRYVVEGVRGDYLPEELEKVDSFDEEDLKRRTEAMRFTAFS
jgi:hypothetical protein